MITKVIEVIKNSFNKELNRKDTLYHWYKKKKEKEEEKKDIKVNVEK